MRIYGKNVVEAALKEDKVKKVYVTKQFRDDAIFKLLNQKHIPYYIKDKNTLNKMAEGLNQGIVADVDDFTYANLEDVIKENGFLVILDHLEDPHNFGAIIRSCEAAGVDAIIIPKDRSVSVNPTVIKVSTGAISNIDIVSVTNINQTIKTLKDSGYWIIGTDMQGDKYDSIDYKGSIAIVVGNEGVGMSDLVKKNCDFIASIPMKGVTNSLNASVACSIILFEAVKNR